MENNSEEPSSAPEPGQWYNIKLGPSFRDNNHHSDHSPKLCSLRYDFKPASIDSSQPGSLHKSKDNRVTVEFHNNQQGKPKVIFEGVEDYRDNDAVLFFDGETFRLERLHRAVNCLRHVRQRGELAATAASTMTTSVVPLVESYSKPVGKRPKLQSSNTGTVHEVQAQAEQVDIGNSTSLGAEPESGKEGEFSPSLSNPLTSSPDKPEENVDIVDDNDDSYETEKGGNASEMEARTGLDIDINLPHQIDIDDEIADVDVSDNEADKGPNAAEALRAQVNAEGKEGQSSSSSSSSDSESTGTDSGSGSDSGSVSTSTDTESSDGDSVNSI